MSRITRDLEAIVGVTRPAWTARRHGGFLRKLKRHPIPIVAHFRHSLVLTYAFPESLLRPLLPPGLILDTHCGFGFVAIALVQTDALRPAFLPACFGQNFFLSGYRIFARYRDKRGRLVRGLRILRSDTNRRVMALFGNLLTHYQYQTAEVDVDIADHRLAIDIRTHLHTADLDVEAIISDQNAPLPENSPFENWCEARLFAGPLPFTFDYETETHSLVLIEGVRRRWRPRPVLVRVSRCTFFDQAPFNRVKPRLANAFYVSDIDYRWNRGVVESLANENRLTPATA